MTEPSHQATDENVKQLRRTAEHEIKREAK